MKRLLILSIISILTLAGCATSPAPDYRELARKAQGPAVSYPQNTAPNRTDESLGINDPAGMWAINRYPFSAVLGLIEDGDIPTTIARRGDVAVTPWAIDRVFTSDITATIHGGQLYLCAVTHTAAAGTEPGVGGEWETVWELFQGGGSGVSLTGAFDLVNNDSKEISNLILFAGESIAPGQSVYGKYDGSNGMRLYLYSSAPGDADVFYKLGVARTAGAVGQPVMVFVGHSLLMRRDIFNFATSSLGKPLWAYSTPGAIGTTVPSTELHHVIKVGTAVATNGVDGITGSYILYRFSIDDTQIPATPVE